VGEFRVVESSEGGVILEPVMPLDRQAQAVAANANLPWSLYETMPADSHELYAQFTDEQLKQLFPAASVEEYLRHGEPATPDDDLFERAGYDEAGMRLSMDDVGKAVKTLYDRPLRDYAYLFAEAIRRRAVMTADLAATQANIKQLQEAKAIADKLTTHRTSEIKGLTGDLQHMVRDRSAIESLLAAYELRVNNARQLTADYLQKNTELARQFAQQQLDRLRAADGLTPAPSGAPFQASP
jgi:hypothetical protein